MDFDQDTVGTCTGNSRWTRIEQAKSSLLVVVPYKSSIILVVQPL